MDLKLDWEDIEKITNIPIKLKNGDFRPVNEWLDDLYLNFNSQQIINFIELIMTHDELFENILNHKK